MSLRSPLTQCELAITHTNKLNKDLPGEGADGVGIGDLGFLLGRKMGLLDGKKRTQ